MVNYEVDGGVLEKYLPEGCEVDLFEGRAFVSLVAFEFSRTSICGVPMPFYRKFPEINLRFYVRRRVGLGWRRGVVFIKEIIPCVFPAWIGRAVFRENFHVMPVEFQFDGVEIRYEWGEGNLIMGSLIDGCAVREKGSEEEFLVDNYWAFKKVDDHRAMEFEVTHRPWMMQRLDRELCFFDIERLYGEDMARAIEDFGGHPRSVFYLDGSEVEVTLPRFIKNLT